MQWIGQSGLLIVAALTAPVGLAEEWLALPEAPSIPADNPQTAAKIELGKQLFFDPRFSSTGTVSCNSCHNLMAGGEDSRSTSMGVHGQSGPRNAPTVWNSAFHSAQFWDGRAASLEEQAKGPVVAQVEMGMRSLDEAIARVRQIPGYVAQFRNVFGGENAVTVDNAAKAVAAFERTLVTPGSAYDRFAKGDESALNAQQQRGLKRFNELGCTGCHRPPAFNGPWLPGGFFVTFPFHDSPYALQYKLREDSGREAVTRDPSDKHKYRVPTLRNVTLGAPYFHNGAVPTLSEAVQVMAASQLGIKLNEADTADIVAFLGALTGPFPAMSLPRLPATPGVSIVPAN